MRRQREPFDDRIRAYYQFGVRRLDVDRMGEVTERVAILGDLGRRGYIEAECDALLIGRVDWRQPHIIMGMGSGLFVNVAGDVFDAETHAISHLRL